MRHEPCAAAVPPVTSGSFGLSKPQSPATPSRRREASRAGAHATPRTPPCFRSATDARPARQPATTRVPSSHEACATARSSQRHIATTAKPSRAAKASPLNWSSPPRIQERPARAAKASLRECVASGEYRGIVVAPRAEHRACLPSARSAPVQSAAHESHGTLRRHAACLPRPGPPNRLPLHPPPAVTAAAWRTAARGFGPPSGRGPKPCSLIIQQR